MALTSRIGQSTHASIPTATGTFTRSTSRGTLPCRGRSLLGCLTNSYAAASATATSTSSPPVILPSTDPFVFPTPDGRDLSRWFHNPVPFYVGLFDWLCAPLAISYADNPAPYLETMFLIQTILTCGALAWYGPSPSSRYTRLLLTICRLLHRAWQIINKPVPELVNVLGLEVPIAPEVSLAGIQSDNVTLHWTPPANQSSLVKYNIYVNGVDGKFTSSE